ncbi:MAG: hypothetical protein GPI90_20905 [Microcystis aeruginosa K13-05]|jgi:hypothetical protein|uniref:hypothetical protein n=1 Tax=unclassified Microcystis TaxID=2643300 RepID=UPI000E381A9D|nr:MULTISPECIES: hypothetical protein [unclassified Microcystis]NCR82250.1 hypothetical protein [Microcystis aeruginosa K13-10]NCR86937.1 hypothetical protein [Microcystis aeruginosa K13-05]REJ45576.1 MAG: hypothetical protein DWQ53_13640 [Microcystis flos-aquae DF17]MCZ8049795.1 hypothetical protein [Microcystis sp. LE19-41.2A]MCZ8290274.1 hypothetical protein [Microcystis sp. LE19-59.1C]
MLKEQQLFDLYSSYGFTQGGELYLPISHSLKFLQDCQQNELAIIGIEGFIYEEGEISPQLDLIADFSSISASDWQNYQNICNSAAKNFLLGVNIKDKSMVFNFVILSRSEWENSI